jgi:2-polyprenyl-3-methyl-5-hydroxy-6-metoxy-1,4-benzoquinol methylase
MSWDGEAYQRRFDELAAGGMDVHGEADFVCSLNPSSVLDAGCGTGRVAMELGRRGLDVVGVDRDASMLDTARRLAGDLTWVEADLTTMELGRRFDVVILAGNVVLFTTAGTEAALVETCARHVDDEGALVAGFQLGRGYDLADYDWVCAGSGLALVDRFASWDRRPFAVGVGYAVSIHRRR